jgi:RNA polymerase sigma factor (sigma-70 family)
MSDVELVVRVSTYNHVLRDKRLSLGLTRKVLCQTIDLTPPQYGLIENLKKWPDESTQHKICTALCVDQKEAFSEEYEAIVHPSTITMRKITTAQGVANFLEEWEETQIAIQDQEGDFRQKELSEALDGLLNKLPEREAEIVWRHTVLEEGYSDIGRQLSLSRERVRQIYQRARGKLLQWGMRVPRIQEAVWSD